MLSLSAPLRCTEPLDVPRTEGDDHRSCWTNFSDGSPPRVRSEFGRWLLLGASRMPVEVIGEGSRCGRNHYGSGIRRCSL